MASLNKVFLAGNLTRDPELRYTPGGTAVGQFGLAVNRRFRNRDGQMQEEATFVDIEVWGRQAEAASEYISKGSPVLIEGRLKLDTWESKQTGERRSKLRVVGERVQFLRYRGDRDRDSDGDRKGSGSRRSQGQRREGERGDGRREGQTRENVKREDVKREDEKRGDQERPDQGGVDNLPADDDIPF